MNKLTAEKCRDRIKKFKRLKKQFGIAMETELSLQAFEIALPILEQQERGERQERGDWIKCSEEMPPKGKTVLVWYLNDWEFGMTFGGGIISIYDGGGWSTVKVDTRHHDIHWQHLPAKPEDL